MNRPTDVEKRFCLECFVKEPSPNYGGEGVAQQYFDSSEEADAWAEKALLAGRFKFLVCYDGISGNWEWSHDYAPDKMPKRKKARKRK